MANFVVTSVGKEAVLRDGHRICLDSRLNYINMADADGEAVWQEPHWDLETKKKVEK